MQKVSASLTATFIWCLAICAQADVQSAVAKVATKLYDKSLAETEASNLAATVPLASLVPELLAFADQPSDYAMHAAANALLWAIKPFPFHDLAVRLSGETDSYRRANLLWLLDRGAKNTEEAQQVLSLAKQELGNEGPASRPYNLYPPELGYSPNLRVCDLAYNILVERMKLADKLSRINSGSTQFGTRNRLLQELRSQLGLPVPKRAEVIPSKPAPDGVDQESQRQPNAKPRAERAAPSTEARQSQLRTWIVLLFVVLAAAMVLRLLMRRLSR